MDFGGASSKKVKVLLLVFMIGLSDWWKGLLVVYFLFIIWVVSWLFLYCVEGRGDDFLSNLLECFFIGGCNFLGVVENYPIKLIRGVEHLTNFNKTVRHSLMMKKELKKSLLGVTEHLMYLK